MLRVLVAYDGSECSDKMLNDLRKAGMSDETNAMIVTAGESVAHEAMMSGYSSIPLGDIFEGEVLSFQEAQEIAEKGSKTLRKYFPKWTIHSECISDIAADGIIKKINQWNPDLVVMGSHGRSAIKRTLFGSISQHVLLHGHCNLRISRGRGEEEKSVPPLRVFVAYDGSHESEVAFETVLNRHWPKGTAIRLVAVIDIRVSTAFLRPSDPIRPWIKDKDDNPTAWVDRMLPYQKKRIEEKGLIAYADSFKGDPKRVLLKKAEEWGADSIFMGSRGLTRTGSIIQGSVSMAIAAHAHCSVEIIHQKPAGN